MFLSSYIQSLFPSVLGKTIDLLKVQNFNRKSVLFNITLIVLISVGTFACTCIWRNFVISNSRELECELREKLFIHFQKMSPSFYSERKTGDLIAYAINDISAVRMAFGPATSMSINGIVLCTVSIYSMCRTIDWRLTLISLLPIPFIIFFILNTGKIIRVRFRKVQECFASISDKVQENIYGIRVIKAYVQEQNEIKSFEKLNTEITDSNLHMVRASSLLAPVIEFSFSISFVINLIWGGNLVLKNKISLGDFIAFNTYLTMIMAPIISMGRVINIYQRGMASLSRLIDIFSIEPEIVDTKSNTQTLLKGSLQIKNLNFSYNGSKENVLENINIDIPEGHTLGIIGKTGSGKSTLVNLLFKLYNVSPGTIFIGGIDINDISLETLRTSLGIVPQDNFLFSATISDNIKFFKDVYSEDEVEKASIYSCIYENILEFNEEFNTILGERGVNLSGGQKQRIAIARALIKNPSILILDDSLSAVDTVTESKILNNLNTIRKGKTNIIIAHRISSIENADEIIVMDKGKICERGTHNELINRKGLYYDIFKEQYKDSQKNLEAS